MTAKRSIPSPTRLLALNMQTMVHAQHTPSIIKTDGAMSNHAKGLANRLECGSPGLAVIGVFVDM